LTDGRRLEPVQFVDDMCNTFHEVLNLQRYLRCYPIFAPREARSLKATRKPTITDECRVRWPIQFWRQAKTVSMTPSFISHLRSDSRIAGQHIKQASPAIAKTLPQVLHGFL